MGLRRRRQSIILALLATLALASALDPVRAAAPAASSRRGRPTAARTNVDCLGKAIGGLESIARFSTLYTRYEVQSRGREGTDVHWRHASGAARESLDVPGAISELVVFDGTRGWRRRTDGAVVPLSGMDLENVVSDAYLGSFMHLVPGRIPGTVERLGLDRASGLVKLRVQPVGGAPAALFLDTLTCLPARVELSSGSGKRTLHLRDWRVVGGIKLPHTIRRTAPDTAKFTLVEARFDAPLRAGIFAKPVPAGPLPVTGGEAR